MAFETLIVDADDAVVTIRLNRPEALNALNGRLLGELAQALGSLRGDERARAVVITGSEKAFAAGVDIKEMADKGFVDMVAEDMFEEISAAFARFGKPIVAAVSGYALGGGCELAMMCDIILAADTARFGQPEINLGVIPGLGGSQRLTRAVGKAKAMEMCLTGRLMDAAEAERSGLVSRVLAPRDLLPEAQAVARKIAEKSPVAVRAAKEAVSRAFETSLAEGLLFERRTFAGLFATEDQAEGMAAFVDKRQARFSGK